MIRPKTIESAAFQAVAHSLRLKEDVDIWISNAPNQPKYMVMPSTNGSVPEYEAEFVATVTPAKGIPEGVIGE